MALTFSYAQTNDLTVDWKSMSPDQMKEYIHKLSPDQRRQLFRKFRENMLISELNIQDDQKDKFISIYNEYADDQRDIKNKFALNKKIDQLTPEEAKLELEKSFEVAQQLLNNREEYSKKFLQVLTPQQILKMYHIEGKTRNEIMDRRTTPPLSPNEGPKK